MSGPGALPRTAHCFFSFTEIRLQGPPDSYTFTLTKRVLRFFEGVKNLDKTKKGEIAAPRPFKGTKAGLDVLSSFLFSTPPPQVALYPLSFFPTPYLG